MQRLIFITSDPLNPVLISLVKKLSLKFETLVFSDVKLKSDYPVKTFFVSYIPTKFEKFIALLYRPILSRQEQRFPERNFYSRFKYLVNLFFHLKQLVNKIYPLPYYSDIFWRLYQNKKLDIPISFSSSDICLTDANLRHVYSLIPFIVHAKKHSKHLCSIVYSWDNTHYSTLNSFSDSYLVWNENNKMELVQWYDIAHGKISIVGSLIHDYLKECTFPIREKRTKEVCKDTPVRVLYAAVFPSSDHLMAAHEVDFILHLGRFLYQKNPQFSLLFRAYPSKGETDILLPLRAEPWIEFYEHHNFISIPRLGNQIETISFEHHGQNKVDEFYDVDCLLSAGSTYTLEYAFSENPIIHIDARYFARTAGNTQFFERLSLYGHLDQLYSKDFPANFPQNFEEISNTLSRLSILQESGYSQYLRNLATDADVTDSLASESVIQHLENLSEV